MTKKLEEFDRQRREIDELRTALRREQTKLARAKAKTEDLVEAVYTASLNAALAQGPAPAVPRPRPSRKQGRSEIALIHLTDLQYGKKTDTYSMAQCEQRVERYADKIDLLTRIQRAAHPVDEAHILLGGDFVEGLNIFPGQAYELEEHLLGQVFGVARITENFVRRLLANFAAVHVWQEEGNHGRLGRKGDWPRTDNTDLMVYRIVQDKFTDEKRVTWHPRHSWYQHITIGNYKAVLIHGDEIKSFGGNTPAFGILRKGIAWSSGSIVEPFTDLYVGHFHTPMMLTMANGGRIFLTGSTESDNEYAREFMAARGIPSQRLHFIDPRRGRVAAEYIIWLGEDETPT